MRIPTKWFVALCWWWNKMFFLNKAKRPKKNSTEAPKCLKKIFIILKVFIIISRILWKSSWTLILPLQNPFNEKLYHTYFRDLYLISANLREPSLNFFQAWSDKFKRMLVAICEIFKKYYLKIYLRWFSHKNEQTFILFQTQLFSWK